MDATHRKQFDTVKYVFLLSFVTIYIYKITVVK